MTSPIPSQSPQRYERKDSHPYAVKTTHTGILARSNSSKAHGSWARHRYVPSTPSPSANTMFERPEPSPSPTRRTAALPEVGRTSPSNKSQGEGSDMTNSPSPSKYSKTWVAYDIGGQALQLPRHPYLWTPSQLATYLSTALRSSEGDPLDKEQAAPLLNFIREQQIGGRAFLSLDEEDFQELEGLDWDAKNALWDATCTLRQQVLPIRSSRVSSRSYKRGRVKGMIGVFEPSASEGSDAGGDNRSPVRTSIPKRPNGASSGSAEQQSSSGRGSVRRRKNAFWDMSESDDDTEKIVWGLPRTTPSQSPFNPEQNSSTSEQADHANGDPYSDPFIAAPETPVDAIVVPPSEPAPTVHDTHPTDAPDTEFPEDDSETPNNSRREIDIASIPPPQHEEELTMAELYEQTYGEPAPSSRTVPVEVAHTGETTIGRMPLPAIPSPEYPSRAPTALRPVRGIEVRDQASQSSPPAALSSLFVSEPPREPLESGTSTARAERAQTPEHVPHATRTDEERAADLEIIEMLRARLEAVERKLAQMEQAEVERIKQQVPVEIEKVEAETRIKEQLRVTAIPKQKPRIRPHRRKSHVKRVWDDEDDLDKEFRERSGLSKPMRVVRDMIYGDEGAGEHDFRMSLRTWQSRYIILAGATTGVSIVLIPMLLRHFWTR